MIDRIRYLLALLCLIALPPGLLFWLVIHRWAYIWRRLGLVPTYVIVLVPVFALGATLFRVRGRLVGADLGMHWSLISIACVLYGAVAWLESQYWRQLSVRTLIGIPELSAGDRGKGTLLKDGVYRTVRHPRYLSAGIAVVANALIANHAGVYVLILLLFPAGFVMLALEERELADRFGEEYRQYQKEVPRLIPRWQKAKGESRH